MEMKGKIRNFAFIALIGTSVTFWSPPSKAILGINTGNSLVISVGVGLTAYGLITLGNSTASDPFDDMISFFSAILGILIMEDGQQHLGFQPINDDFALKLGLSAEELKAWNDPSSGYSRLTQYTLEMNNSLQQATGSGKISTKEEARNATVEMWKMLDQTLILNNPHLYNALMKLRTYSRNHVL